LFASSHVARGSGAYNHFRSGGARIARGVDHFILRARWPAGIPRMDDARNVARLRDRRGALPRPDSGAVKVILTEGADTTRPLGQGYIVFS
jgi:hypothetical protein